MKKKNEWTTITERRWSWQRIRLGTCSKYNSTSSIRWYDQFHYIFYIHVQWCVTLSLCHSCGVFMKIFSSIVNSIICDWSSNKNQYLFENCLINAIICEKIVVLFNVVHIIRWEIWPCWKLKENHSLEIDYMQGRLYFINQQQIFQQEDKEKKTSENTDKCTNNVKNEWY